MALTKLTTDVNNIQKLADRPTETPTQIKAAFDKAGADIKEYINNTLTEEIDATFATKQEVADIYAGGVADNSISNAKLAPDVKVGSLAELETTEKSSVVAAVNSHLADNAAQHKIFIRDILRMKLRQTGLNLDPNAWSDTLEDENGINTALSSGYYFDNVAKSIRLPNPYEEDLCHGGTAIANGGNPDNAFDNDGNTSWTSPEFGTGVNGVSWVGYDFGVLRHIRKITVRQHTSAGSQINSAKFQSSADGITWVNVQTLTLQKNSNIQTFLIDPSAPSRYWRLLANSNPSDSYSSWGITKIEMMDFIGDEAIVVWNSVKSEGVLQNLVVESTEKLGSGDIAYYISRDDGNTFTECFPDAIINISSQPNGVDVVIKVVLNRDAELLAIAWGGSV